MRRRSTNQERKYRILVLDDEIGIVQSLEVLLRRSGYDFLGLTDPLEAVERMKDEHFDMLILDYIMGPLNGDQVVARVREFNQELYILLLTGHKDLAPPLVTIKALDIQGYYEKSDRFDQLMLLIESGIKSITQIRTIKRFQDGLNKILQAVPKIYQLQSVDHIIQEILEGIMPLINSENAFVLVDDLINPRNERNSIFRGIGIYNTDLEKFFNQLGPDLIEKTGYARANKQIVQMENGLILPLIDSNSTAIGVIYIESNEYKESLKLFQIFAHQAALALHNAFLHSLINIKNEELDHTYDELRCRYLDTIEVLRLTVDAKDVYTRGHSDRVAYIAHRIGLQFDLSKEDVELLRLGGVFHDIGKIGTTDDILLKVGQLNDGEYEEIKKHPLKGAHILSAVSVFKEVVPLVKYHHERPDGKGYPTGLKNDDIPLLARILSVADAYDAMTSDRQYRSRLDLKTAKEQLLKGRGCQFDANAVDCLIHILDDDYFQFCEELSTLNPVPIVTDISPERLKPLGFLFAAP